jgi:hypothetical protein
MAYNKSEEHLDRILQVGGGLDRLLQVEEGPASIY